MPSVCILTSAHFCRNPRVVKEAQTLATAGYEVTVLAPILSEDLRRGDEAILSRSSWQHKSYCDLRPCRTSRMAPLRTRLVRRFGVEAVRWLGWQAPHALGYAPSRLLEAAYRARHDLYIAHLELGNWAACELATRGRRVGADFEDWYSRDLLPQAMARRPLRLLRRCEEYLLRHGAHVTTTSAAMAEALAAAYGSAKPRVLYNAFPWSDRTTLSAPKGKIRDRLSIHWVSQTIGVGRGLETLGRALHQVKTPVHVSLRGAGDAATADWVRALLPADGRHSMEMHGLVPPADLLGHIACHDIGLALEPRNPANKDLTVSNKILHYLLAGLAVIATDTQGQAEVASATDGAIRMCHCDDAYDLARQLNFFIANPDCLRQARAAALESASKRFCWERQAPVLLESVEAALDGSRVRA